VVTALEELTARITAMAEASARDTGGRNDAAGASLFEVERALQGALRRLRRLRS